MAAFSKDIKRLADENPASQTRARCRRIEHLVRLAVRAADQADLFQVVLGFEQVALLGLPHAVVRPSYGVIGIGGKSALVSWRRRSGRACGSHSGRRP